MCSNFKEQAMEFANQAVQEDHACNYIKAVMFYIKAIEYFKTHLKYEKDPEICEDVTQKVTYYLRRKEEIRSAQEGGEIIRPLSNNSDSAVVTEPKSNTEHGEENTNNVSPNPINKGMYSNFKEQAIEYVKQAVAEDNAGNYPKAFFLYMNALEYFKTHLKYEKNPKIRDAITQKFTEYLRRAEEIRFVLDDGVTARPKSKPKHGGDGAVLDEGGTSDGGDVMVAVKPKVKKDGQGGGEVNSKLGAGWNSAIVREKPNVKWSDVAGLENAKQALQEAVILPVKFPQFFTGMNLAVYLLSVNAFCLWLLPRCNC